MTAIGCPARRSIAMIKPDVTSRRKRIEALKANLKKGIAFQKVSDTVKRAKLRREPPQTDKLTARCSVIRKNSSDRRVLELRRGCNMITTEKHSTGQDHREGVLAKTIEEQTAKLPSDTFLWLALGSIATSLTLKISGREKDALFVGQWAPTFLLLGVYNKLVKQLGSDRAERPI